MAKTPQRTRRQDFIITQSTDAIRGDDGTQGQSVLIRGGHSSVNLNAGGQVGLQGGNPGTGGIGGNIGILATSGGVGAASSAGGIGGSLVFAAGAGAAATGPGDHAGGAAGTISIQSGAGALGSGFGVSTDGGNILIQTGAGAAGRKGGDIQLITSAGPGPVNQGGSVVLFPALGVGGAPDGTVQINSNALGTHGLTLNAWPVGLRPYTPSLAQGTFWVQAGAFPAPNLPYFTDNLGTDHNLLAGGAGVGTYDSYLDQAAIDADPVFSDMPPIAAKIAGLPALSVGYPVTNTLHFIPGTNLALVTPLPYLLPNTEIRGTAPIGPFGTVANDAAVVTTGGPLGPTFQDIRTFKDVCFNHAEGPTFTFTNSPYCEFDNVSMQVPSNGSPTTPIWYQDPLGDFERLRINKTSFGSHAWGLDGGTLDVIVETGNFIGANAFVGTGTVRLFLRGSGNSISTSQGTTLDIDVGDASVAGLPKFSGADEITFGAGTTSWNWSAGAPPGVTGFQLCPGGGMSVGDPAPFNPGGGAPQLHAGRFVRGIVRGIHVQIGANVSNTTFTVDIREGGVLKYQEGPFSLLGCVGLGTYLSTTFGELTGAGALRIEITPAALSQGDWDHINVTFFVR